MLCRGVEGTHETCHHWRLCCSLIKKKRCFIVVIIAFVFDLSLVLVLDIV